MLFEICPQKKKKASQSRTLLLLLTHTESEDFLLVALSNRVYILLPTRQGREGCTSTFDKTFKLRKRTSTPIMNKTQTLCKQHSKIHLNNAQLGLKLTTYLDDEMSDNSEEISWRPPQSLVLSNYANQMIQFIIK